MDNILNEIKCFTLASHLFWSLWALVNLQSEIQFGYWVRKIINIFLNNN